MKLKELTDELVERGETKYPVVNIDGVDCPIRRVEVENDKVYLKVMLSDGGKPSSWDKYQLFNTLVSLDEDLTVGLKLEDLNGEEFFVTQGLPLI